MSDFIKKSIAVTTSVTTILALSGVALFAPVFVASAATIVDGDTIKTADHYDVYIAKHVGDKKFKRLILNPTVFESYGHLSWDAIKTVTQAEMDEYTTSDLVRAVDDPKVYKLTPDGDEGARQWVNMTAAEFVSEGYDWDSIYEINTVDRDNYTLGSDVSVDGVTPTGEGVTVSLASDSPAAGSVAMGAQNVIFAKINFVGGENTTVSQVKIRRAGLANDADLSDVKLWEGSTQLGATQALNTTTHKAVFTGLGWVVPAGTTKVLTVTGSIAGTGTAATGTAPSLGVEAAADVTATTEVKGTFPVYGKTMSIAGIAAGRLDVTARGVPADNSPISGSVDQEIASFNFQAVTEAMSVRNIKLTQIGSASNEDISNIKLMISGAQIGSTISALATGGTATFDLTGSPLVIDVGTTKIVYVNADIAAGITTARTVEFEITNAADVTAIGSNSAGSVTPTTDEGGDGSTFVAQDGVAQTISQGTTLTVSTNGATNPTAQNFVRGASQVLISGFKFANGAGEDQRVARLKLSLGGTGAGATDISNVTLYKYDQDTGTETQVGSSTSFVGTVATYGSSATGLDTGVFDVAESTNYILHVRADVSSAAAWTGLGIFVNEVKVDGIQSAGDNDNATITAVDVIGEVTTHAAALSVGTIAMATAPSTPAAQNVVPGTTGFVFGKFDFTMTGEDATLSSVTVNLCDGVVCVDDAAGTAETSDITNVKLWNGATQLGTTSATPSTSATFSFNLVLPKNEAVTLSVTGDVPTNAYSSAWSSSTASVAIDFDITATGVSSSATVVDPTVDAIGNLMTANIETLTATFIAAPASTVILNANQAVLSKVVLTAGTAGDVRLSSIKFTADDQALVSGAEGASEANLDLGTLKLVDVTSNGDTQLGNTLSGFTNVATGDTATFSGLSLLVPKGTQKVLELRGNVLVGNTQYFFGIDDLTGTSDVVATGLSSNTTVYGTGTEGSGLDTSGGITLSGAGTLAVAVDAATPLAQYAAVGATAGKTGVDFAKWKFTSTNEAIELEQLTVTLQAENNNGTDDNDVPNFAAIHLYNGATEISSTGYLTGTNAGATTTHAFTFAAGTVIVPKDDSIVLTLKGDLNGTSAGANSTTTPRFHLEDVTGTTNGTAAQADDIVAKGVDSGARVTSSAGTPTPETVTNQNEITIVRGKPVFALCTASNCTKASPSGSLVPGTTEVIRFRIAAEGYDVDFDATNHNIAFTIAQSGGAATTRSSNLYEQGVTAAIATALSGDLTSSTTLNFTTVDTTISAGTYKEYYVEVDLTDYAGTGESFRLSILNTASDLSWSDGLTTDISIASITDGLPITGGTLVK